MNITKEQQDAINSLTIIIGSVLVAAWFAIVLFGITLAATAFGII